MTGKTVLVVEDHEDSRDILCELLEQNGILAIPAGDGIEAIEKMVRSKPDLVLTDLHMPNMDGLQLAQYVKSHVAYREIPVALISANLPSLENRHPEISAFLLKPCSIEHLLSTISRLLLSGAESRPDAVSASLASSADHRAA
ncbi:response regulator [Herbaspirillum lusitanum]|uniref:Response regulator n=1 Tax=Herbaspirillum lusitanum TaxID=213312 RepID=A0ABW9ABY5_9BURK